MLELIQGLNSGAALILVLLVLTNPNGCNRRGNLFLGLFMLSVFVQLFDELIRHQGIYETWPYLGSVPVFCLLLMPPLLYLGIVFYVKPNKLPKWKDLRYFVLGGMYLLAMLVYYMIKGDPDILNRDIQSGSIAGFYVIFMFLFLIQIPIFWYKGFLLLGRHQENIKDYSAANEDVGLGWLVNFNYLYLFMIVMWVCTNFVHTDCMLIIANVAFLVGSFLMVYHSFTQKEVFPEDILEKEEIGAFLDQKVSLPDDPTTEMSEVDLQQKGELLELMQKEKPYLDNDINLSKLSKSLGTSTHQLSATLNNAVGMNFSNFINSYRMEEAKSILLDPEKQHYTMVQVAFEAGYNSKTVFNTHFKRTTGFSPTAYKRENLPAISA